MDEHEPSWTVESAQANLTDVIDRAHMRPQTIVCDGKPAVVVVSVEDWAKQAPRRDTLADFLLRSPLRGLDLDLDRCKDPPRDVDF